MKSLERRGKYVLLTLALVMFASLSSGYAQGEVTRKFGLTGSLQGGQTTILVPLWLGDRLTVAPGFSLLWDTFHGDSGLCHRNGRCPRLKAHLDTGYWILDAGINSIQYQVSSIKYQVSSIKFFRILFAQIFFKAD